MSAEITETFGDELLAETRRYMDVLEPDLPDEDKDRIAGVIYGYRSSGFSQIENVARAYASGDTTIDQQHLSDLAYVCTLRAQGKRTTEETAAFYGLSAELARLAGETGATKIPSNFLRYLSI